MTIAPSFKIILILFALFLPLASNAELQIVTSITPLASLVAMIAGDKAEVSTMASDQGCPHHHALKPSDISRLSNTDLFIYIDDDFDAFATKLLPKFHGRALRISDIQGLKLVRNNNNCFS
jgi:zinc transport system substrate-binding protein